MLHRFISHTLIAATDSDACTGLIDTNNIIGNWIKTIMMIEWRKLHMDCRIHHWYPAKKNCCKIPAHRETPRLNVREFGLGLTFYATETAMGLNIMETRGIQGAHGGMDR